MNAFHFAAVHWLLLCVIGLQPANSLQPAIYPPTTLTSEGCSETTISNFQLSDTLLQISQQLSSSPIKKSGSSLEEFLKSNPRVEEAYYNGTYHVQKLQPLVTDECLGSQEILNEPLVDLTTITCETIYQMHRSSSSGSFLVIAGNGSLVKVYCDMEGDNCGGEGGWMRVAHLDMTQSGSQCPQEFRKRNISGVDYCGRFETGNCISTTFSTLGIKYKQVCGRLRGYQYGSPTSFYSYWKKEQDINGYYMDGASITYGSPRKHLWTFACGIRDSYTGTLYSECPCNTNGNNKNNTAPAFVGDDYYCESGATVTSSADDFFPDDPLWDGKECNGNEEPCCTHPKMPWFIRTLDQTTNEDIELRLCANIYADIGDDVLVDKIDLYIR